MLPTLHILHLSRRVDREQQLIRQLEWNKVHYLLWEGMDDPTNVKQAITKGFKRVIQYAKDNQLSTVNYAEDDIIFTNQYSYKYFNEQTPEDFDLWCGVIYAGEVNEDNRILNGMSATQTLIKVHERFYDFILSLPDDIHIDRHLGQFAYKFKYYVCSPFVCKQSGGYSDNLRQNMWYDVYLEGKKLYGVD